jgi:DNA repair exonuclease SbcCD ATPase subunit
MRLCHCQRSCCGECGLSSANCGCIGKEPASRPKSAAISRPTSALACSRCAELRGALQKAQEERQRALQRITQLERSAASELAEARGALSTQTDAARKAGRLEEDALSAARDAAAARSALEKRDAQSRRECEKLREQLRAAEERAAKAEVRAKTSEAAERAEAAHLVQAEARLRELQAQVDAVEETRLEGVAAREAADARERKMRAQLNAVEIERDTCVARLNPCLAIAAFIRRHVVAGTARSWATRCRPTSSSWRSRRGRAARPSSSRSCGSR